MRAFQRLHGLCGVLCPGSLAPGGFHAGPPLGPRMALLPFPIIGTFDGCMPIPLTPHPLPLNSTRFYLSIPILNYFSIGIAGLGAGFTRFFLRGCPAAANSGRAGLACE